MSHTEELSELDKLLVYFTNNGGSDLFITAGRPATMKREGGLVNLTEEKLTPELCHDLCYQLMNKEQTEIFEETQECNLSLIHI